MQQPQKVSGINYIFNDKAGLFQSASYNFKSPALSLGYMYRGKPFFFRIDLSYWMGRKNISYSYFYRTSGPDLYDQSPYPKTKVGDIYYSVNQEFQANVKFHYLDFNATIGKTLGKYFTILTGLRTNSLIYHVIQGNLDVYATKYMDNGNNSSGIELEKLKYHYKNNQAKSKTKQTFQTGVYLTFGINAVVEMGERDGFIELDYNIMTNNPVPTMNHNFFNLKTGIALFKKRKRQ